MRQKIDRLSPYIILHGHGNPSSLPIPETSGVWYTVRITYVKFRLYLWRFNADTSTSFNLPYAENWWYWTESCRMLDKTDMIWLKWNSVSFTSKIKERNSWWSCKKWAGISIRAYKPLACMMHSRWNVELFDHEPWTICGSIPQWMIWCILSLCLHIKQQNLQWISSWYDINFLMFWVMSCHSYFPTLVPSMLPRKKTQAVKDEVMRLDVRHSHSFYYVSTNLSKLVHALKIKSLPKYISYLKYVLICMMHICCPLVKSSCYVAKEIR